MQLDVVQAETIGIHQDIFLALVDEDTDTFGSKGQILGFLTQATGRFGVEDEANHIHTQLFYSADVVCFRHSAYFDNGVHGNSD